MTDTANEEPAAPRARRPALLERAFELARSGKLNTTDELRRKLKQEQYEAVDHHLGGSLLKQLRTLMTAARAGGGRVR